VWALTNALFGLSDLVDDGTITGEQALEQLTVLITATLPTLENAGASRARQDVP
jgi:hypothetical protein